MLIKGKPYQSLWLNEDRKSVSIIDQRQLPFSLVVLELSKFDDFITAIRDMYVRGAPLIGATAAWGMYVAVIESVEVKNKCVFLSECASQLKSTRPTAVDLFKAVDRQLAAILSTDNYSIMLEKSFNLAKKITYEVIEQCKKIGDHGLELIEELSRKKKGETLNILTHCNAGWLATVEFGTATAPIYFAHDKGIKLHVWVDETRPRNQGSNLTAFELGEHGVPHTIIADNTGGHLMQHGMVDLVIVGSDRTTRNGDVANKIGTYLKALAAFDNHIPFYVAVPSCSIDFQLIDGVKNIKIEERGSDEVKFIKGLLDNKIVEIQIGSPESQAANFGFDVTPARLVSGLITERGICKASENEILNLFPEYA